ncbi:MAG: DUF3306 domain-containing protein [Alkalilacustris sp.]
MSGGGFLDRWSRRKRAAAEREDAAALEPPGPESSGPEAQDASAEASVDARGNGPNEAAPEEPGLSEEEIAALPPVEEITPETDLRQYLRKGVPRALRNAALRRKWLLNATIRDHKDIAVDYAWDWNVPGGVPGDGGPLDHETVARMARQLLGPKDPAPGRAEAVTGPDTVAAAPHPEAPPPPPPPARQAPRDAGETPSAGATSGNDGAERAAARGHAPSERAEAADTAPQRRHGGAAPV